MTELETEQGWTLQALLTGGRACEPPMVLNLGELGGQRFEPQERGQFRRKSSGLALVSPGCRWS